jgi:hypothetical protein
MCGADYTLETEPPTKPHGLTWACFCLCAHCGHVWRAEERDIAW